MPPLLILAAFRKTRTVIDDVPRCCFFFMSSDAFAGGRRMKGLGWTENTGRGSTRSDPESLLSNEGNLRKCCKRVRMYEGRLKSLRGASAMKKR